MSENNKMYGIQMTRNAKNHFVATNGAGASVAFGRGEGLLSPVELLLAAVAGCSAIDVDVVTSRRTEPTKFVVRASGEKIEEDGATRLAGVDLEFELAFPDDQAGRDAAKMVERLVQLSHDKHCTVSRTVEHETPVSFRVLDQSE